ncbi:hypothetical protein D3C73_1203650 [compost metagenome]
MQLSLTVNGSVYGCQFVILLTLYSLKAVSSEKTIVTVTFSLVGIDGVALISGFEGAILSISNEF